MAREGSVAQIKARFNEYVRAAQEGEPVIITRRGRAVAAIVGAEELRTLQRLRAARPEAGLATVAGGWEDSGELVRILEASPRA